MTLKQSLITEARSKLSEWVKDEKNHWIDVDGNTDISIPGFSELIESIVAHTVDKMSLYYEEHGYEKLQLIVRSCYHCKQYKDLNQFSQSKHSAQNRAYLCKECTALKSKYYYLNRMKGTDRVKAKALAQYEKKKKSSVDIFKNKTRSITRNAIKSGRLIPQPCINCGDPKPQAHHNDYRDPFNITWLCRKCHVQHHKDSGLYERTPNYRNAYECIVCKSITRHSTRNMCGSCYRKLLYGPKLDSLTNKKGEE